MNNVISNVFSTNELVCKLRTVSSSSSSLPLSSSSATASGHSSTRSNFRANERQCTTIGCLRLVALVAFACILCLQSVPTAEGLAYPYNLMGVPPKKPSPPSQPPNKNANNENRVTSTATNSPIYYINKLDLSSLFLNLLPGLQNGHHQQQSSSAVNTQRRPAIVTTQSPLLEALVASALEEAKKTTANSKSKPKTPKPFKRIPLPFVSNAKPVASYELSSSATTEGSSSSVALDDDDVTTTITTTTTTAPTTTTTTTTTKPPPWLNKYPPSKLIRLKTKFVANGHPSAVYVFKSPARRYFLQDLLRRPTESAAEQAQVDKRRRNGHHPSDRRKIMQHAAAANVGHFRSPRKNHQIRKD